MNRISETQRSNKHQIAIIGDGPSGCSSIDYLPIEIQRDQRIAFCGPEKSGSGSMTGVAHRTNSTRAELAEIFDSTGANENLRRDFENSGEANSDIEISELNQYLNAGKERIIRTLWELENDYYTERAEKISIRDEGDKRIYTTETESGRHFSSENLVLATGSRQVPHPVLSELAKERLVLSRDAVTPQGISQIKELLFSDPNREILIIGGSHSAAITPPTILPELKHLPQFQRANSKPIKILSSENIPLFFENQEEERRVLQEIHGEKWHEHRGKVCKNTGRINRWNGVRRDALEFILDQQNGQSSQAAQKTEIIHYDGNLFNLSPELREKIKNSVVIQAFGWQARSLPIYHGEDLISQNPESSIVKVNNQLQILDRHENPIGAVWGNGFGLSGRDPLKISSQNPEENFLVGLNIYARYSEQIRDQIIRRITK